MPKTKSKNNEILSSLPHYTTLFVFNLGLLCYNPAKSSSMCIQLYNQKMPILQNLRLVKIANFLPFSVCFFFRNLLSQCDDIEKNHGPKYSSLNELTAHDCIKTTLIQIMLAIKTFI